MIRALKFSLKMGLQEIAFPGDPSGRPTLMFQGPGAVDLKMWVPVNDEATARSWLFYVALTGEPLPEGCYYEFIGSAMTDDKSFVVHLFRAERK